MTEEKSTGISLEECLFFKAEIGIRCSKQRCNHLGDRNYLLCDKYWEYVEEESSEEGRKISAFYIGAENDIGGIK